MRALAAWVAMVLVVVAGDVAWLGFIAKPLYQRGIGHLMAPEPLLAVAAAFYAIFALGLLVFAVAPPGSSGDAPWGRTLALAAFFAFCAYATYDLSNWSTLRGWPASLALVDMAWGTVLGTLAAAAGRWVYGRL